MATYLAIDFGGGSGRVIAGTVSCNTLKLKEIYRFPNRQVRLGGHVFWDFLSLFQEMKNGIRLAFQQERNIKSIGIDTWGVDFGLIDEKGNLLGNPVCYRDSRTEGLPERVFSSETLKTHYAEAGIQVMSINTLYQLVSMKEKGDAALQVANRLLFMPDLFSYYLTGVANNEYSIASTSELLDARSRSWNRSLIQELGLPQHIFSDIIMPGTVRGKLREDICQELEIKESVDVVAVGSHDTASAVFAVPEAEGKQRAFLSSGTWSLLGTEVSAPILTEEARLAGFTNEGGVGGKIRFLQNITGLWMLQRLIAEWDEKGLPINYDFLLSEAEKSSCKAFINVDAPLLQNPSNMQTAIAQNCEEMGYASPQTQGEYVRCVLQSLAQRYKQGIEQLNSLIPTPIEQINIVGGGSRNKLLNRLTSEATGLPVVAGPVEATAIGNILVQAIADGEIKSKSEISQII